MNTIAERIYDFLKGFPPFNMLTREQLFAISQAVEVSYVEKNKTVFSIGESIEPHFYVVKDGAIGLYAIDNTLVDECDEGDIFGLRALIRTGDYILEAKAMEESVLYSISSDILNEYITKNADASKFLMQTFVSNVISSNKENLNPENEVSLIHPELQSADYSKNPITCTPITRIKDAALIMTQKHVGSIVVVDNDKPIGIITDKDLRTKIATGETTIEEPVSAIMSSPVKTFPEKISVAEAQIAMLKHKITHLCITKDGTPNSKLTGILSEHDIIVLRENNASSLIKEVKRSSDVKQLKTIRRRTESLLQRYLNQDIPIDFVARMVSAINNSITQKLIEFSIAKMNSQPPVAFAWLAIGSQGREEQLLLTDQDNALVFDNVQDNELDAKRRYFLELANHINQALEIVGFKLCPADMMARNPKWCNSLDEWKHQFKSWITTPDQDNLMLCTIFFDYDFVYGDHTLVDTLSESIFEAIETKPIFLNYLGRNALQNPPPLSFFRQFLVEDDGEHKDHFDIKVRAMMPLVDAARLLILSHNIKSVNNTVKRYEKLIELEPQNKDVYSICIECFKDLLTYRTEQGLAHSDSGRFIDLEHLTKADRLKLKRSFKAVKSLQELVRTRFRLSQLM